MAFAEERYRSAIKFNEIWEREWYKISCFKNSVAHVHLQIKTNLR